jgi:hypothetical protein
MKGKLIFVLSAVIGLVFFGTACRLSPQALSSISSPSSKYKIDITQKRDSAGVERFVYLNAYRDREQFVYNKLLYTGDFLDDDFRASYPTYSWVSESTLKIGRALVDTQSNRLTIRNTTTDRISYLLIETYKDKYVLFDVEPESEINLMFQFLGQLSCQGEFAESKERFGSAVRLGTNGESEVEGDFSIRVEYKQVNIDSSNLKLRRVTCCAVDRPDINHEGN